MGILRTDRVSGLGGANAIKGSTFLGTFGSATYGNQIEIQKDTELDIGDGNLTVECWFNSPRTSGYQSILGQEFYNNYTSNKVSFNFYLNSDGIYLWNRESGSAEQKFGVTGLWVASTWNHVAWVREGTGSNENKIYLNGSLVGSAFTNNVTYSSEQKYHIGGNFYSQVSFGQYPFSGHISNLRMSNIARYTANFTPPTSEFAVDSNTILLTCQSPSNILKEETGKILSHNTRENNTPAQASRFTPNSPVGFSTTTDVGTQFGSTFDGVTTFDSQAYMVPPGGNTRERNRGRALWAGGDNPGGPNSNVIDFIQIQSGGTGLDFGDLSVAGNQARGVSSFTRGVFGGGRRPSPATTNTMDFVTIANTANALDFGDLTDDRGAVGEISSSTRGIFAAGYNPSATNTIDFVTIATLGNASNFGDTTIAGNAMAGTQSTTRGILAGGYVPSTNVIQFLTIATTGDAQDFGDLTTSRHSASGTSNGVRAVFMGGDHASPAADNTIDFITIASTGNATDFGDLGSFSTGTGGATSDKIRGVFGTGWNGSNYLNVIQQVTIATTGNSVNIGELTLLRHQPACLGDAHGGLSE